MFRLATCVFIGLLLAGCATTYGPMSNEGGYSDLRVSEFVHRINVSGNGETSRETVQNFALLRASELTLANGRQRFVILSESVQNENQIESFASGSATTTTNGGKSSTTFSSPEIRSITKAGGTIIIELIAPDDARYSTAYDANLIDRQLRPVLVKDWSKGQF